MLELFLIAQTIQKPNYIHLTNVNKTTVENLIYHAPRDSFGKPVITTPEISEILGFQPQCSKTPTNPQIKCVWSELNREIRAYFFVRPEGSGMEFQKWDSTGFNTDN